MARGQDKGKSAAPYQGDGDGDGDGESSSSTGRAPPQRGDDDVSDSDSSESDYSVDESVFGAPPAAMPPVREAMAWEKVGKDKNAWNKRQAYTAMALVTGLTVLFQIQSEFPSKLQWRDHALLLAFGMAWLLGACAFMIGLAGPRQTEGFSRCVGRSCFICFCLLVHFAVYLMSLRGYGGASSGTSSSTVASAAATPTVLSWVYLVSGIAVIAVHALFGCKAGGNGPDQ